MSPDDDDLVAAEYVLGTLDADERGAAEHRREQDAGFAALVVAWEHRLAPLSEAEREQDVPGHIWAALARRLGFAGPVPSAGGDGTVVQLNRSVRRWRWATAGVSALAACLAALVVTGALRDRRPAGPQLVAFLQRTDDAPAFVVKADLGGNRLDVRPVAAHAPAGRSYELWIIEPRLGPPRSLGVLAAGTETYTLPAGTAPDILQGATYAVTDEPAGGSPTGRPSGPPVYLGHLVSSAP